MLEELEKIVDNQIIVLDTSVINLKENSLARDLYDKWRGMRTVSREEFRILNEMVGAVEELVKSKKVFIIPEVVEEAREFLRIINGQRSFFNNTKPFKKGRDFRHGEERSYDGSLSLLGQYCDRFHRIVKRIEAVSIESRKEIDRSDVYSALLGIAGENVFEVRRDFDKRLRMKNYLGTGVMLNTDSKIVASAFMISYRDDVLMITRDKKMINNAQNCAYKILDGERREKYGISRAPEHSIIVFNPDLADGCKKNPTEIYNPLKVTG